MSSIKRHQKGTERKEEKGEGEKKVRNIAGYNSPNMLEMETQHDCSNKNQTILHHHHKKRKKKGKGKK